jgi:pyridoxal 5'-phosphate synthase pdxT subunit
MADAALAETGMRAEGACHPASVGVLALQGGFEAHARMLRRLGARPREVRVPADLRGLQGLVLPGGESTTMTLGIEREGLAEPLRELIGVPPARGVSGTPGLGQAAGGIPVLGSCAGLIMLDRDHLALMDIRAQRNAFGRQSHSFEADLRMRGIEDPSTPLRGVFIRAPWIAEHGPRVEILAELDGHPVAAREGDVLAVAFHAELTDDVRVHRLFLDAVARWGAASHRAAVSRGAQV